MCYPNVNLLITLQNYQYRGKTVRKIKYQQHYVRPMCEKLMVID